MSDNMEFDENAKSGRDDQAQSVEWETERRGERSEVDSPVLRRRTCPGIVTLIAVFQFLRGAVLFLVSAISWTHPDTQWGSLTFWGTVYVASNGGGRPGILTPITAVYAVIIGWGLWSLKAWARNLLMLTSGLTAIMWIRYLLFNQVIGGSELSKHVHGLRPGFEQQAVSALVLADSLIFCCLAFYPDVAEAFGRKK